MSWELEKIKVCSVIVTYNRKELLVECLQSLCTQTHALDAVLIVDNASKDNTPKALLDSGYIQSIPPDIFSEPYEVMFETKLKNSKNDNLKVIYIRMNKNTGGAGGFHQGVKRGYELGFDWLWLMDDDGLPKHDALEKLINKKDKAKFLNPLVLSKDALSNLSFSLFDKVSSKSIETHSEALMSAKDGLIYDAANPFNGTFISKELIQDIGFPKKELFIWGDEVEYQYRAIVSGHGVATVVDSIHYHPKSKVESVPILGGRYRLNYQHSELKNYCDIRNRAYIHWRYGKRIQMIKYFLAYSYFFLTRLKILGWFNYMEAIFDGIFPIWGKEKRFLKPS
jgi:rhamnopyranosyl-N-acetylglucosaminyl-diphospho-decaprenol beta-1,3/1,4-galactofuranosyltransferase